jgi:hypothetical protein
MAAESIPTLNAATAFRAIVDLAIQFPFSVSKPRYIF